MMRSQAEAVVAEILDGLGVVWEYEKHSVVVGRWKLYIPDFYLPEVGVWIEVKGPAPDKWERWRCMKLAEVKLQDVYCVWDYGESCMLFRRGWEEGVSVGGLL
jgi:hypothetical protein